jgi:hypothetical protein
LDHPTAHPSIAGSGKPLLAACLSAFVGPAASELAADAHHCIMVWAFVPTAYKDVARVFVHHRRAPLGRRHPDHTKRAVVLGAVKDVPYRVTLTRHP